MYTAVIGIISALILFWFPRSTCGYVQNQCDKIVTNATKLRWSTTYQGFYAVPADGGVSFQNPEGEVQSKTWCILNPERLNVLIRFDFRVSGDVITLQNCISDRNAPCKSLCLAVEVRNVTDVSKNAVLHTRSARIILLKAIKVLNTTNPSNAHSELKNTARQSNNLLHVSVPPPSRLSDRRRRSKRRKCKFGRKKMRRMLAQKFLLNLAEHAKSLTVSNYSTLSRMLLHNTNLRSQINELVNCDKGAILTYLLYIKSLRATSALTENGERYQKDERRIKRNPEYSHPSVSDPNFCGVVRTASPNPTSKRIEELAGEYSSPVFPFVIEGTNSKLILNLSEISKLDEFTLKHMEIFIRFVPTVNTIMPTVEQRDYAVWTSANLSNGTLIIDNTPSRMNNVTIAAGAIAGGIGLLFVSVVVVILCTQNRKKRRRLTRSKAGLCEDSNISESEHCLSTMERVNDKQAWKGSDSCSDEGAGTWDDSDDLAAVGSNRVMLDYKKSSREKNRNRNSSHSNAKSASKVTSRSTCQHNRDIQGSSRHDHCIVCQIAGKPHKPIMNARQYASQIFPPAKRHTQGAAGATFNDETVNSRGNNAVDETRNSTSLFPWTVRFPDGEGFRGAQDTEKSLMSEGGSTYSLCIKAPPNITIYSCEPLPFATFNNNSPKLKVKGAYSRPATSVPKHTSERSSSASSNGSANSRTAVNGNGCVCRYLMNHIDDPDPPPEYSEVMICSSRTVISDQTL